MNFEDFFCVYVVGLWQRPTFNNAMSIYTYRKNIPENSCIELFSCKFDSYAVLS
jgi:hypothetical protein